MKHIVKIIVIAIMTIVFSEPILRMDAGVDIRATEASIFSAAELAYVRMAPPSLQVYLAIKKYCLLYGVPEYQAFRVANLETTWMRPFQRGYNAYQVSSSGALGPMQVLLSTAKDVWDNDSLKRSDLLYDIDFNIHTSIKYQRQLYDRYKNWETVYAIYNTGYTKSNEYSTVVSKRKK